MCVNVCRSTHHSYTWVMRLKNDLCFASSSFSYDLLVCCILYNTFKHLFLIAGYYLWHMFFHLFPSLAYSLDNQPSDEYVLPCGYFLHSLYFPNLCISVLFLIIENIMLSTFSLVIATENESYICPETNCK